jgi:hypothetical protein
MTHNLIIFSMDKLIDIKSESQTLTTLLDEARLYIRYYSANKIERQEKTLKPPSLSYSEIYSPLREYPGKHKDMLLANKKLLASVIADLEELGDVIE